MRLYSIAFLIQRLKLSITEIDREVKAGRIERVGTKYALNQDYGQSRVKSERKVSDEQRQQTKIGMYVGRRYSTI